MQKRDCRSGGGPSDWGEMAVWISIVIGDGFSGSVLVSVPSGLCKPTSGCTVPFGVWSRSQHGSVGAAQEGPGCFAISIAWHWTLARESAVEHSDMEHTTACKGEVIVRRTARSHATVYLGTIPVRCSLIRCSAIFTTAPLGSQPKLAFARHKRCLACRRIDVTSVTRHSDRRHTATSS